MWNLKVVYRLRNIDIRRDGDGLINEYIILSSNLRILMGFYRGWWLWKIIMKSLKVIRF